MLDNLLDSLLVDDETLPSQIHRQDAIGRLRDRHVHHLHENVDYHGNERQSDEQVERSQQEELWMLRNDVAESDRTERYEHEVEGVEVRPVGLPGRVQSAAEQHIDEGDQEGDDRRQIERVVDLVGHELLVGGLLVAERGFRVVGRLDRRGDVATPESARPAATPSTVLTDRVLESLEQSHSESAGRHHATDPPEAAGVVEAADERPQVLDGVRERLAEVHQDDQTERYADDTVQYRDDPSFDRQRVHIAVTCIVNRISLCTEGTRIDRSNAQFSI